MIECAVWVRLPVEPVTPPNKQSLGAGRDRVADPADGASNIFQAVGEDRQTNPIERPGNSGAGRLDLAEDPAQWSGDSVDGLDD
ncbi:hypothetical protein D3C72_475240 [compost metagenome]